MSPDQKLEEIFRLTPYQKAALHKLGLQTARNLLYHFPFRFENQAPAVKITNLKKGDNALVYGVIHKLKTQKAFYKKIPMAEGWLEDETGKIKVIWFNQPYLAKMLSEGVPVMAEGKVTERKGQLYIANPQVERVASLPIGNTEGELWKSEDQNENGFPENRLRPFYPESRGITSNWFYFAIAKILRSGAQNDLEDPIPKNITEKYKLPCLKTALVWIHNPKNENDAVAARKRFAFEEVFFIQLQKQIARREYEANPSFRIEVDEKLVKSFLQRFPFAPTNAQMRAMAAILEDFKKGKPMMRLLEGDVGSGKTFVAAATAYAAIETPPVGNKFARLQVALMAPTEILAKQHFESFIENFSHMRVSIGLITSGGCQKFPSKTNPKGAADISRAQLLRRVKDGQVSIVIGTHSLIQKTVEFKNLAYAVVDEQHRFGVKQRAALVARGSTQINTRMDTDEKRAQINTDTIPQIHADASANQSGKIIDSLLFRDLTYIIRGAAFEVQNQLGNGHKELVYQNALAEEFQKRKINFSREKQVPVNYNGKKVGQYQPDFIVDNKILLEVKALPYTGQREKRQFWNYLKGSEYQLAILVNFGTPKVEIIRIVNEHPRISADNPRQSAPVAPHLLSMTATPIPRTLALTVFGDLDLTLLDEMPPGRKQIITKIVAPKERSQTYEEVRREIKNGRQVYVVCPRIDEPDPEKEMALDVKSVKEETERLRKEIFPEFVIEMLHGKMKTDERDKVMGEFKKGKINILVATSVIEVGVNVPNATTIVIEGAERFGLSQLHQLRGRVLRSTHQSYCYVFTSSANQISTKRLRALGKTSNGFELAEYDLKFRGAGDLSGLHQWGISDIAMEALQNLKMVEAARAEAQEIIEKDPELIAHPALKSRLANQNGTIHLE